MDPITNIQYSGFFQSDIRKMSEQGKVADETREKIFQSKLEEEMKTVQPSDRVVQPVRRLNNQPRYEKPKKQRKEYNPTGEFLEEEQSEKYIDTWA